MTLRETANSTSNNYHYLERRGNSTGTIDNNISKSSNQANSYEWNLQGTVNFKGKPCAPNSPSFRVPPCSGPYPGYEIEIYTDEKNIITKAKTDVNGNFKLLLKPGKYLIYTRSGISKSNLKTTYFAIEKGKQTILPAIIVDTGLR